MIVDVCRKVIERQLNSLKIEVESVCARQNIDYLSAK